MSSFPFSSSQTFEDGGVSNFEEEDARRLLHRREEEVDSGGNSYDVESFAMQEHSSNHVAEQDGGLSDDDGDHSFPSPSTRRDRSPRKSVSWSDVSGEELVTEVFLVSSREQYDRRPWPRGSRHSLSLEEQNTLPIALMAGVIFVFLFLVVVAFLLYFHML
eukprot:TRINITY_DN8707_c0_g1_i1.p1 TRINITY_DN8707_c0_g1~~TRINITY_DN8707_c0_g1_i1.p1  ORF type:complete len:161 (-),score=40.66 TRINITY_DN8707_c0_g1_i1:241-723(-)